jgi:polar amino acid transport system substrate-binding protein
MKQDQILNTPEESYPDTSEEKSPKTWIIVLGILLVAALFLGGYLMFKPKAPNPAEDLSWQNVQQAGVLKVGTAADYPPFSYYNDQHGIDGFDPALIQLIGRKLGVRVEITDFAFEGINAALQIHQVDVIIAALSVTPGREALVKFSNIYYVGEDGILARDESGIESITSPNEMAGKRIGVQENSTYETWVRTNLINTGKLEEKQLFVYAQSEHAINDLKQDRLDLVMMDLQPATLALADGGIKLVGQGINQQRLAIALPLGAEELAARINQALQELQNEGVVAELAHKYLGLNPDDLLPTPTPAPTATEPTATPDPTPDVCVNSMAHVKDLTYDDHDLTNLPVLDKGEAFQKGWRIKNTGTCDWTGFYFIKYARGNKPEAQMQGQPTVIEGMVKPGQKYDIYIDLVAPQKPGEYIGYWQMHNAENESFGEIIWVAIEIPSDMPVTATVPPLPSETPPIVPTATETPEPTATDEPGADLRDHNWIVEALQQKDEDDNPLPPLEDVDLYLLFEEGGQMNGTAGCNNIVGQYATDNIQIDFTDINITNQFCTEPPGVMEQEARFLSLLDQTEEYRVEDDKLKLVRFEEIDGTRTEIVVLIFGWKDH